MYRVSHRVSPPLILRHMRRRALASPRHASLTGRGGRPKSNEFSPTRAHPCHHRVDWDVGAPSGSAQLHLFRERCGDDTLPTWMRESGKVVVDTPHHLLSCARFGESVRQVVTAPEAVTRRGGGSALPAVAGSTVDGPLGGSAWAGGIPASLGEVPSRRPCRGWREGSRLRRNGER